MSITAHSLPGRTFDPVTDLVKTSGVGVETYMGETYRLERREITSFLGPNRKVWCWEVKSGPAGGHYGGKCGTKAEARGSARTEIEAWAEEAAEQARQSPNA